MRDVTVATTEVVFGNHSALSALCSGIRRTQIGCAVANTYMHYHYTHALQMRMQIEVVFACTSTFAKSRRSQT